MTPPPVRLFIPGPPRGQARPRFTRQGRPYTTTEDRAARAAYAAAWRQAGSPPPLAGPAQLAIAAFHPRPAGHTLKAGGLSADGRRHPRPHRSLPDLDNVIKLALDALKGLAFIDDRQIVSITAEKAWAPPGGAAGVACTVRPHRHHHPQEDR